MSPPHSEMVSNVWKPTVPIQPGAVVTSSLISQFVPPTSHNHVHQPIS